MSRVTRVPPQIADALCTTPSSIATIMGASLGDYWTSDTGIVTVVDGVKKVYSWTGRISGKVLVQAYNPWKPLYSATGCNGHPIITFDPTVFSMSLQTAAWAGLVQPCWVMALMRPRVAADAYYHTFLDGVGATCKLYHEPGSAVIRSNAGSAGPTKAFTSNTWQVVECSFTGANSVMRINGGLPAQADTGANNPGGLTLGNDKAATPTTACDADYAALVVCTAGPNRYQIEACRKVLRVYGGLS